MVQVRAVPTPPWCGTSYSRSLVAACPLCETYPRLKPWASLFRPARWNSFVNSPRSAGDAGRVGFGGRWPDLVGDQPSLPARKINQTPQPDLEPSSELPNDPDRNRRRQSASRAFIRQVDVTGTSRERSPPERRLASFP